MPLLPEAKDNVPDTHAFLRGAVSDLLLKLGFGLLELLYLGAQERCASEHINIQDKEARLAVSSASLPRRTYDVFAVCRHRLSDLQRLGSFPPLAHPHVRCPKPVVALRPVFCQRDAPLGILRCLDHLAMAQVSCGTVAEQNMVGVAACNGLGVKSDGLCVARLDTASLNCTVQSGMHHIVLSRADRRVTKLTAEWQACSALLLRVAAARPWNCFFL